MKKAGDRSLFVAVGIHDQLRLVAGVFVRPNGFIGLHAIREAMGDIAGRLRRSPVSRNCRVRSVICSGDQHNLHSAGVVGKAVDRLLHVTDVHQGPQTTLVQAADAALLNVTRVLDLVDDELIESGRDDPGDWSSSSARMARYRTSLIESSPCRANASFAALAAFWTLVAAATGSIFPLRANGTSSRVRRPSALHSKSQDGDLRLGEADFDRNLLVREEPARPYPQ